MFKVCRVQPSQVGRLIREREADVIIGVGIGGPHDTERSLQTVFTVPSPQCPER